MELKVIVKNKIAKFYGSYIVCGNSDYVIKFNFDSEWDAYETKTARFKYNGTYTDVVFTGSTCNVPVIQNTHLVTVGVYAGDLHTTTPAIIPAKISILCGSGTPAAPTDDVYSQIMEKLNNIEVGGVTPEQIQAAVESYLSEHPVEVSDVVKYVAQTLTDEQKAQARENIGAGTSDFDGSYNSLTDAPTIPDISGKVDKAQGTANSGKYLAVGSDGNVTTVDAPSGGGGSNDISLGLTGATVGQIIRVKSVDDLGKPTEWEITNGVTREKIFEGSVSNNNNLTLLKPYTDYDYLFATCVVAGSDVYPYTSIFDVERIKTNTVAYGITALESATKYNSVSLTFKGSTTIQFMTFNQTWGAATLRTIYGVKL